MSTSQPSFEELRAQLRRGEIDRATFARQVQQLDEDRALDALWARWAEQGLFDDPVAQDGFTSIRKGVVREVDGDG